MKGRVLTLLCGISQMGKSFLAKKKIIPAVAAHKPVIIFDKNGEYAGQHKKDTPKGYKGFNSIWAFLEHLKDNPKLSGINVIRCTRSEDYEYGINFFYTMKYPVLLVLDEAHFIFTDPELKKTARLIKNLARFGSHYNIGIMLISQRTMDIPPDIRSQFLGAISFKQTHQTDVKALESKGWDNANKILDLKAYEYEIFGELHETLIEVLGK